MNNLSKKITPILLLLLCTSLLGLHLQTLKKQPFFYREQQQIFLFDTEYVLNILKTIGGLATICSQFIIQFFKVPLIGSLVTALIGGISGWLFWLTLRKIHPALYLMPWPFSPSYSNIFT